MIRKIAVDNLKCSGCETSVKQSLLKINGVNKVDVNIDHGVVTVTYDHHHEIWNQVKKQLDKMGYVEKGTSNFIAKAKSYANCAIGKMSA